MHVVALGHDPHSVLAASIVQDGVDLSYVTGSGLRDVRRVGRLAEHLRHIGVRLVHTHTAYANTIGPLAARLAGLPSVSTIHGMSSYQSRWDLPKRVLEAGSLRAFASRIVVVAAAAVAEAERSFWLPRGRIAVIPNAVEAERFRLSNTFSRDAMRKQLGIDGGSFVICTVGRLVPVKGHAVLLQAAARLRSEHPRARFLLIGDGPERHELASLADQLGIAAQVLFLGERADIPELLGISDLFVLPSLSEALPQALLEAMAAGLAPVATRVGGAPDVIAPGENGWLVPPGDMASLSEALADAMNNHEEARRRGARARSFVEKQFSMNAKLERLELLYQEVLQDRR